MKILSRTGYLIFLLAILLTASESFAAGEIDATTRYNEAGALYRDGQFDRSLSIYEELIGEGINNPDLYYNTSNAAYRTGSPGKAILYLERALKLAPSDKEALANLAYLNSIKKDQEIDNSNVVLVFLTRRYNAVNVNSAAVWSGAVFAAAMAFLTAALFVRKWKRVIFAVAASLLGLVFIVSTGIFFQKVHHNSTVIEGIIMTEEAPAYSGPGVENTHIFTIHEGTKVVIERNQDAWNLIRLNSGAGGWIKDELMEEI